MKYEDECPLCEATVTDETRANDERVALRTEQSRLYHRECWEEVVKTIERAVAR